MKVIQVPTKDDKGTYKHPAKAGKKHTQKSGVRNTYIRHGNAGRCLAPLKTKKSTSGRAVKGDRRARLQAVP